MIDVARVAGVSKSTVSRVLNDQAGVDSRTRERVLEAMSLLSYRPNELARGLLQGRTGTLGLVLFNLSNPFFSILAQGAILASYARGYTMFVVDTVGDVDRELECLEMLAERRVDGVVLGPLGGDGRELPAIESLGLPLVLVDATDGQTVSTVGADNVAGGRLATEHLIGLGHRRIAFVSEQGIASGVDRLAGYRSAHREAALSMREELITPPVRSLDVMRATIAGLWSRPEPPTAIFTANDYLAIAALQALTERGIRVPHEVALVGFDDLPVSALLTIPLTTIAQPIEEQGRLAVNLLIDELEVPGTEPRHLVLQPRLIVRKSSQPKAAVA